MINIKRVGHVGIHVSDVERSLKFYTEVMGFTITAVIRGPDGTAQVAFTRCEDKHHDFVLFQAPEGLDVTSGDFAHRLINQVSFEVDSRDEWLKALSHIRSKGVEIVGGPVVHSFEGNPNNIYGSGSRAFYFCDPDGNRLEIYTDMMRVPNGEQFPRKEYADLIEGLAAEARAG